MCLLFFFFSPFFGGECVCVFWFILVFLLGGTLASAFLEDSFLCPSARTIEEDTISLFSIPSVYTSKLPFWESENSSMYSSLRAGVWLNGCICLQPWLCINHNPCCPEHLCNLSVHVEYPGRSSVMLVQLCISWPRELLTPLLWMRQKSGSLTHLLELWCHFRSWQD